MRERGERRGRDISYRYTFIRDMEADEEKEAKIEANDAAIKEKEAKIEARDRNIEARDAQLEHVLLSMNRNNDRHTSAS